MTHGNNSSLHLLVQLVINVEFLEANPSFGTLNSAALISRQL